uniref:ensconsin-like isoform X1 n=1 Tax=Doryrhamphus excisus TaxID=161450 RepID=UPI0025AE5F29|nr:ensconsin-like isoform X1 [Doryrhamphus excisus]
MPGCVASMAVQRGANPPPQPPRSTERRTAKGEGAWRENNARADPRKVTAAPRPNAVAGGPNLDERLRAARERREEQQRLLAWRVQSRQEREQRARRHYEEQLQERQRKLREQKIKEEKRRCAVEEKRKQRLQEEKERNECAVRRTQEKSQKAQQNFGQNLRGRKSTKNVPRHLALSQWEKKLVSRLLTPTSSYLARSKSSDCQSGQEVSFYSTTSSGSTPQRPQDQKRTHSQRPQEQKPQNQRPQEQKPQNPRPQNQRPQEQRPQNQRPQNQRLSPSPSPSHSQTRSTNHRQLKTATQHDANKRNQNVGLNVRSAAKETTRTASSPSPEQSRRRSSRRHSIPLQLDLPSVPEEDVPICNSALSPGNSRPLRIEDPHQDIIQDSPETNSDLLSFEAELESRTAGDGSEFLIMFLIMMITEVGVSSLRGPAKIPPNLPEVQLRPSAGTTNPVEASRLLAEKRREARMLREREEQDRVQAAEAETRGRAELERRRAEAQRLIADKRRREEEEHRRAVEERAQAMREAALLHKQREEEQAREREKAAQLTKERELLARKEEAERQVRKKVIGME